MRIPFTNPRTGNELVERDGIYVDGATGQQVGAVVNGIPRFVEAENYAESFGFQWNTWEDTLSDTRSASDDKYRVILERTKFDQFDTEGKTLLECGMGGGDDTEVLLKFPFSKIYSFDFSNSVDRARKFIKDDRSYMFQASILGIPLPDRSFDFVFCHRVIQHTPDPEGALRSICRKVKPGGVLFVHSYNKSFTCMMSYKYKYRWITKRFPAEKVKDLLDRFGPTLFSINEKMAHGGRLARLLARNFVPFELIAPTSSHRRHGDAERLYELAKLVTFDALTPQYDKPMRWKTMHRILREEGMAVKHAQTGASSPLWCTAVAEDNRLAAA